MVNQFKGSKELPPQFTRPITYKQNILKYLLTYLKLNLKKNKSIIYLGLQLIPKSIEKKIFLNVVLLVIMVMLS